MELESKESESLDDLLLHYIEVHGSLSSYELAKLERKIWEAKKASCEGHAPVYRNWMVEQFGGYSSHYEKRQKILNLGDWSSLVWAEVDSGRLSLGKASDLIDQAKAMSLEKDIPKAKAFTDLVAANAPNARKKPTKLKVSSAREFGFSVRRLAEAYVNRKLGGVEESIRQELTTDFMAQVKVLCSELSVTVRKYKDEAEAEAGKAKERTWREYKDACAVLGLLAHRTPLPVEEVKKRFRRLASRFHPDKNDNGDAELMLKQYQAVCEAYETIKDYMRGLNDKK